MSFDSVVIKEDTMNGETNIGRLKYIQFSKRVSFLAFVICENNMKIGNGEEQFKNEPDLYDLVILKVY